MDLTYVDVINNELVSHTKLTTSDSEKVTYYIDRTIGWNVIDKYVKLANSSYVKEKSIDIYKKSGKIYVSNFGKIIQTIFSFLDLIILFFTKPRKHEKENEYNLINEDIGLNERI